MKRHWTLVLLVYLGIFLLVGCSPAAAETTPTPTLEPVPTAIAPTPTPEPTPTQIPPTPTLEPTPTRTPIPLGKLEVCLYFEGELVEGYIQIKNEFGEVGEKYRHISGCGTFYLVPGYYEVVGSYWQGPCATNAGCGTGRISFVMEPKGLIEKDFELIPNE